MQRSMLASITGVLVAMALMAAGCGDDSDDTSATDEATSSVAESTPTTEETTGSEESSVDDVESTLESSLESSGVSDVSCPDDAEIAAGATFTCELSGNGGASGSVDVTLDDDTGSSLSYKGSIENGNYTTTLKGTITSS